MDTLAIFDNQTLSGNTRFCVVPAWPPPARGAAARARGFPRYPLRLPRHAPRYTRCARPAVYERASYAIARPT